MRQTDLVDYPLLWDEDQLRPIASEVHFHAGDPPTSSSVGSPADHSGTSVSSSPSEQSAFAWMADRIQWELRLDELRGTRAREQSQAPARTEESA
jgi:hypothetical protein